MYRLETTDYRLAQGCGAIFHRFPPDDEAYEQWVEKSNAAWI